MGYFMKNEERKNEAANKFYNALKLRGYTRLGDYKSAQCKVVIMHDVCGYQYEVSPRSFVGGSGCIKCSGLCRNDAKIKFEQSCNDKGFTIVGKYVNAKTKLVVVHSCGHRYETIPDLLSGKTSCPECAKKKNSELKKLKSKEKLIDLANSEGYKVVGEYVTNHTNIDIQHNECGHTYSVRPSNFKSGKRCPRCMDCGYNQTKHGKFYVYKWTCGNSSFLDYGITNRDLIKRLNQKLSGTEYTPELVGYIEFDDGSIPLTIETKVSRELENYYTLQTGIDFCKTKETVEFNKFNLNYLEGILNERYI